MPGFTTEYRDLPAGRLSPLPLPSSISCAERPALADRVWPGRRRKLTNTPARGSGCPTFPGPVCRAEHPDTILMVKRRRAPNMWGFRSEELPGSRGLRFATDLDGRPATFWDVLRAWQSDATFRSLFNAQLASAP